MTSHSESRDTSPGGEGKNGDSGGSGGKTRSRAGCLTCRQRKKKCDETRLPQHNGACERCYLASYECIWPQPPGLKPVRPFTKGTRIAKREAKQQGNGAGTITNGASTVSALPGPTAGPSRPQQTFPHTSATPSSFFPTASPALTTSQQPLLSQQSTLLSFPPASTPHAASLAPPFAPTLASSSAPSFPSLSAAPIVAASSASAFLSLSTAPTLAPAAPTSHLDFAFDPFAPYDMPGSNQNEELSSFFASLDSEFGNWKASSTGTTPNWGDSPGEAGPQGPLGSVDGLPDASSSLSTDAAVPPPDGTTGEDGEPLDPAYNEVNTDFFASLPKPVRDVVVSKIFKVAGKSVSSRNAGMAMAMLYRLRQLQKQQLSNDPTEAAAVAKQQERLLAAGNAFFQKSVDHLAVSEVPFEVKILATLDLLSYQFDVFGAAACHAIHLLAEFFISDALGSQPMLQLDSSGDATSIILIAYAWTDVLRCLHQPKRRPLFAFPSLPGDSASSSSSTPWQAPSSIVQAHLGLPLGLLLCIAAIANLSAEMDALPDEVVKAKAEAIERAIRDHRPPTPDAQDLADGGLFVEKVGTAEMWRHACIIFLHQAVYSHGPLQPAVLAATTQILTIGARLLHTHSAATTLIDPSSDVPIPASVRAVQPTRTADPRKNVVIASPVWRDGPWFLVGTCVTLPHDRMLVRRGLEQCGNIQAYKDDLAALEKIWAEVDEKGWLVDWRAFLQERRIFVEFM
ncbi:hypothetical protein JCM11251_001011 [Rhodosporidiobolus azoricus]